MDLSPALVRVIEERSAVGLADGLDDLARAPDGLVVRFKRYLPQQILTGERAELLLRVALDGATIGQMAAQLGRPSYAILTALRVLEREHIVVISSDGAARATD